MLPFTISYMYLGVFLGLVCSAKKLKKQYTLLLERLWLVK